MSKIIQAIVALEAAGSDIIREADAGEVFAANWMARARALRYSR
jgi:hypothetical protein